jgi:hypothetical protein
MLKSCMHRVSRLSVSQDANDFLTNLYIVTRIDNVWEMDLRFN